MDVVIDLVAFSLAIGISFFAFLIRNKFRGGMLWRPWQIIGPAPPAYAAGELVHVGQGVYGDVQLLQVGRLAFEGLFLVMLLHGFYLFYRIWARI